MSDQAIKGRLVKDACDAQRAGGHEVTPRENENLFTGILQESDRRESEAKPVKKVRDKTDEQAAADFDTELGKRQERHGARTDSLGAYEIVRREVPAEVPKRSVPFSKLPISHQRLIFEKKLLQQRLNQLKSKPEWRHRVDTCVGNLIGAKNRYEHAAAICALNDLVEKSNLTFGDWRTLPVQKLHFHGKGP